VVFTPDGNCLVSPVGNRITVFDLVKLVLEAPFSISTNMPSNSRIPSQ
jgi:periodic tryptophan protein 2